MAKCAAFHALGWMPGGSALYALAQRHITRSYFTRLTPERIRLYGRHVEHYRILPGAGTAVEFGAGGELLTPLLLSAAGATVYACDIARLATAERVNGIIDQLRALGVPGDWRKIESLDDLERYRIRYLAPFDLDSLDVRADFICSTSTLEHVPETDIPALLATCLRLAAPGARLSFIIDYHDHWPGVPPTHFYRYSARSWTWRNPAWHHQNRLRHCDFRTLFEEAGFAILNEERTKYATEVGSLSPCFAHYGHDDLLTMQGEFVLTPAA